MIYQLRNIYGLRLDAAMKDVMSRDVLEASLTVFSMKPQKNSITITTLHNKGSYCLEDARQSS
jgi:hypothetical protein